VSVDRHVHLQHANRDSRRVQPDAAGGSSSPETCDGLDNDCNNIVDDGASVGTLTGQEWVTIPAPRFRS